MSFHYFNHLNILIMNFIIDYNKSIINLIIRLLLIINLFTHYYLFIINSIFHHFRLINNDFKYPPKYMKIILFIK